MRAKLKEYLPESYRTCFLEEKLDQILRLTQDCNSTLKEIELRCESRRVDDPMVEVDIFVHPDVNSVIDSTTVGEHLEFLAMTHQNSF